MGMAHPDGKPSIAQAPISMILPVRDRGALLERAVAAWAKALRQREQPFELIVVDDGSRDDTAQRAESWLGSYPEVIFLRHEQPQGFGAAIRTAWAQAHHPLIFITSLDYPYTTSDLGKLLDRIDDCDLVSGFRAAVRPPGWYVAYRRVTDLLLRVLIGFSRERLPGWLGFRVHLYNRLMRTILGVQLDDAESAYKLLRREVLECFPIQSDGIFALTEIAAKANFVMQWLDEVPIGAQGGVPAEALRIPFSLRERWRDFRRVFFHPQFHSPSALSPTDGPSASRSGETESSGDDGSAESAPTLESPGNKA